MASRPKRLLSAAVLLPLLLFAVSGTSFAAWRCQYDGIARPACCCPKAKADASPAKPVVVATISAAGCCSIEHTTIDKTAFEPTRNEAAPGLQPSSAGVCMALTAVAPSARPARNLPAPEARPPGRPAVLLQKRSFLI